MSADTRSGPRVTAGHPLLVHFRHVRVAAAPRGRLVPGIGIARGGSPVRSRGAPSGHPGTNDDGGHAATPPFGRLAPARATNVRYMHLASQMAVAPGFHRGGSMQRTGRLAGMVGAAAAVVLMSAGPAAAAAPTKFTFSTSGVSADAVFTNAPSDYNLVPGKVYTDVFVYAADQATKSDGTRYEEDFAFVDAYSYKIDRRGNYISVSSSFGFAGNDQVSFSGDARRLSTATLTARVDMHTCDERACTPAGVTDVSVSWSGTGSTSTFKGTYRTSDPGQFTSTGRFSGTSRQATASGTVPVLGSSSAVYGSISSGTYTDRTICHAC